MTYKCGNGTQPWGAAIALVFAVLIAMNQVALGKMNCRKELRLIPGATHLFQEPGTLEQVAGLAADWFQLHFKAA